MYMAEHIPPDIAAAKADHHLPGVLNYMAGHIGQVVDYSPVPAPLDSMPQLWVFLPKGFLAYHTQDIEGDHGQFKNQGVRVEFPGRKAFQIHIGFEFAVVLFAFAMGMVIVNNFLVAQAKVCPECIHLYLGSGQVLAVFVSFPHDDFIYNTQGNGFIVSFFRLI